ncbi:MAG: tRNA pseudouridine(55) synthase TruB [Bacillota bacterium]|nr:tRNA pseudouridine(55) synthase TruB [Bacillota bacterium]
MHGFLNVNKSKDMTSFDVIRRLKRVFPRVKMGHLGTLDPMAEGVLPIAIGNATRVLEYVEAEPKIYAATMTLGGISDTQDATGNICYSPVTSFDRARLAEVLDSFTGKIQQVPPMYSAVHHDGERLYDLARKGIEVERKPREINIHSIELMGEEVDDKGLPLLHLNVTCSTGTYIRTLCHDIGEKLGIGAFLSKLTRTRVGIFLIQDAYDLNAIRGIDEPQTLIKEIDFPLYRLPEIRVMDENLVQRIKHGNLVAVTSEAGEGICRVYDPKGCLFSIARCEKEFEACILKPIKVFN